MKSAVLLVGLLGAGCATSQPPMPMWQPPPPAPPVAAAPPKASCTEHRRSTETLLIRCQIAGGPEKAQMEAIILESMKSASVGTVAAGKTWYVAMGDGAWDVKVDEEQIPVQCREDTRRRNLYVLGAALQGLGNSMQPDATANCRPGFGNSVNCDVRVKREAPLPPPPAPICTGGGTRTHIRGTTYDQEYELLTDEQATARDSELIPAHKRPFPAAAWLQKQREKELANASR